MSNSEQLPLFDDEQPAAQARRASFVCADVLAWAEEYQGPKFHALVTDPPYELGFMGKAWDRSGIAFKPETWKALAQHLLPGAFGLAFASARGWHRLACAIEDAGLIIHPSLFGWGFGQGFPKSSGVEDARFGGHRYGMQALKPALEPIICFQKPYQGKPVDSIVRHGAGTLWIDGARLPTGDDLGGGNEYAHTIGQNVHPGWDRPWMHDPQAREAYAAYQRERVAKAQQLGRWPPNLALVHDSRCRLVGERRVKNDGPWSAKRLSTQQSYTRGWKTDGGLPFGYGDADGMETVPAYECDPSCPIFALDQQAGPREGMSRTTLRKGDARKGYGGTLGADPASMSPGYGDTGGASRFFQCSDWSLDIAEQLSQTDPVFYAAKSSRRERDAGLNGQRNLHPTVKPLSLLTWLCRLLAPPEAYAPRRLVVPFCGSGSEVCAAVLSGCWEEVLGIELDADYVCIAEQRLTYWQAQGR